MSLPDFVCIGAQKAGTSWIDNMLRQSPHIWLPAMKELHYFDRNAVDEAAKEAARDRVARRAARNARKNPDKRERSLQVKEMAGDDFLTEQWYRGIFDVPDRQGKKAGEITPAYLILEDDNIREMRTLIPEVKVFAIVREPLARSLSQLRMALSRSRSIPETEEEWREFAIARIETSRRGDYLSAVPKWQSFFGPDQFLVLPFGMIRKQPADLLRQVETFIGAEPFEGYRALEEPVHKSRQAEIPQWVIDELDVLARPQRDYLVSAFGSEFYEKTI